MSRSASSALASSAPRRFVVLGNPENRRVALFQGALARLGEPPARVVSWLGHLTASDPLEAHLAPGTVLRVESPGESWEVERELIARGAPGSDAIDAAAARRLDPDPGRIWYPRQWWLGFEDALCGPRGLRALLEARAGVGDVTAMNAPADISCMFEKRRTWARLVEAGVPVPRRLSVEGGYEALRERMRAERLPRVFVKLATSSSASGVVALETAGPRAIARTTVEVVRAGGRARFYNSLKVRRYDDEREIAAIVDFLAAEGVHVEEWIPKAAIAPGRAFDLRVVAIGGRARHVVVRTSRSPVTNLHLGNRRGEAEAARRAAGERAWELAIEAVEQAAASFPECLYVCADVMIARGGQRVAILELNAFGDLLPRVHHDGLDTYAAEVAALLAAPVGG